MFRNKGFLRREVVSTWPNPQAGGPPRVGCPRLLIQYIHSYPPNWRLFHHPQPEDAPYCGDRDPLITWKVVLFSFIKWAKDLSHCWMHLGTWFFRDAVQYHIQFSLYLCYILKSSSVNWNFHLLDEE